MGPLPWVSVWVSTLGLLLVYTTLVYFLAPSLTFSGESSVKKTEDYFWKW